MFVITGATGNIGSKISEGLLAQGKKVRAIARTREKLTGLEKKGAEIAVGSMEDSVFLAKSFAGAEAVYVLIPPSLTTPDLAAYQDRIGESIAKALDESKVKNVVHLSSLGAHVASGNGPVAGLYRQERRLNALAGVNVLHMRPSYFMENHLANLGMIKGMGIIGGSLKPDVKIAQIATRDIADHAVKRMLKADYHGQVVQELLGPRDISMQEVTAVLGKAIGKPELPYVQFPEEDAVQGMIGAGLSRSMAESYVEMNRAFNEGIHGKVPRNSQNTTPTSIEEFAAIFARAYQG